MKLTKAKVQTKPRDKVQTHSELLLAIQRIRDKGLAMSISAVAVEAGVDPSLIHHVYPDLAEKVRKLAGRSTREQRDAKHKELDELKRKHRELAAESRRLRDDVNRLASLNYTLEQEVVQLRATTTGKVLPMHPDASNSSAGV